MPAGIWTEWRRGSGLKSPTVAVPWHELLDDAAAERYRALARRSIDVHGGRYVVRAMTPHAVEGEWPTQGGMVIVAFPSTEVAHTWYDSPEYAEALAFRDAALNRRLLFVEGAD
jgi:uncharacterized protein (DUF1330 family)